MELTQEELDKIIADRLKRQEDKFAKMIEKAKGEGVEDFLSGLDLDKEGLTELLKNNSPDKDQEIAKLRRENEKAKRELEKAASDNLAILESVKAQQIDSALTSALSQKCNPEQMVLASQLLGSKFDYVDSKVVPKNGGTVESEIDKFLKDNPFMQKPADPQVPNPKANPANPGDKPKDEFKIPYSNKDTSDLIVMKE